MKLSWRVLKRGLKALSYSAAGAFVVLLIGFVVYMNNQTDLQVWHLAELDEEFTINSKVQTFEDYLALEERLFEQLDTEVYAKIQPDQWQQINRYSRGSRSDPLLWSPNWNRSFEMPATVPVAGVLLLHGMSDSPYSLRQLGEDLNAAGVHVLGLRLPGHGTAPSGLVDLRWQDMDAAVRLAIRHLATQVGDQPLYIVGYSTGAALAVYYALNAIEDHSLPAVDRLVVLSPAIGVTPAAALAMWQARLGRVLGLEKLAWNAVLPEYDPFKYGSFAVNAGNVVYQLTNEIQERLTTLGEHGGLEKVPPILAFSSVVDATVLPPALVSGLFKRLPANGHELVLFDIDRTKNIEPLLKQNPAAAIRELRTDPNLAFTLTLVTNENAQSKKVVSHTRHPGHDVQADSAIGLSWPEGVYSLAHVALPFAPEDSLYGGRPGSKSPGIWLGSVALRGERGVLQISASEMLRMRWNPFYPYVQTRTLAFLGLAGR